MFSNVFKTIQFYPKGGLTIQLWRTGRFVELDPTLRQSDGLAVELNWKQQSRDINLIKGWFPDGIKGALNCICVDSEAILLEPIHSCFVVVNHLKILFCPADWQLGWVGLWLIVVRVPNLYNTVGDPDYGWLAPLTNSGDAGQLRWLSALRSHNGHAAKNTKIHNFGW